MFDSPSPRSLIGMGVTLLLAAAAAIGSGWFHEDAQAGDGARAVVPKHLIRFDDGDSIVIRWPRGEEVVRVLGIDTPEVQHLDHDIPYAQPFGAEAAGFLRGCLAVADEVELLRAKTKDDYGRTLAYVFVDKKNYSVLAIEARLATGPSGRFGDNGLPAPYAACRAAARKAGPVPFEAPYKFRGRMRDVSKWMKKNGTYPVAPDAEER